MKPVMNPIDIVDRVLADTGVPPEGRRHLAAAIVDARDKNYCPDCGNTGWVLTGHHAGAGNDTGPITLNLTACYYPTCKVKTPRPIATLGLLGMFTDVIRHPSTTAITAVTGFTEPVWR